MMIMVFLLCDIAQYYLEKESDLVVLLPMVTIQALVCFPLQYICLRFKT